MYHGPVNRSAEAYARVQFVTQAYDPIVFKEPTLRAWPPKSRPTSSSSPGRQCESGP